MIIAKLHKETNQPLKNYIIVLSRLDHFIKYLLSFIYYSYRRNVGIPIFINLNALTYLTYCRFSFDKSKGQNNDLPDSHII